MARKAGKPNTFLKGMKVDMDPAFQPKSSYRFARNAKILSNEEILENSPDSSLGQIKIPRVFDNE